MTAVGGTSTPDAKGNGAARLSGRPFAPVRGGRRATLALVPLLALAAVALLRSGSASGASPRIEHVVVILKENHSFDNVLGPLCIQDRRRKCNAASSGKNEKGEKIPLSRPADKVVSDQGYLNE